MSDHGDGEQRFELERQKAALFQLLGSAHTLAILREFADESGPLRFSDLQDSLAISPTTLSDRLEELTEEGLVKRVSHDEIPPRVEYHPTEKGKALAPIVEASIDWIRDYGD